jgi:HrpA-like RNA helicase
MKPEGEKYFFYPFSGRKKQMDLKTVNPYTGVPFTEKEKEIVKRVLTYGCADPLVLAEFNKNYKNKDVVVFKAGTGTGKGVVIAPHVMNLENLKGGRPLGVRNKVVITEPRSTNCKTATYVGEIYGSKLVNYGYRFNNNLTEETLLSFVTDGLLANYFFNDPELKQFKCVIIDEVHERNKNIDTILAFCRLYKKKTVILSATIDVGFYKDFFIAGGMTAADMDVPALPTKPVKDVYMKIEEDYVKQALELVKKIILSEPGDILVFLSSAAECKRGCKELYEMNLGAVCYEFHRDSKEDYIDRFKDADAYKKDLVNGKVPNRKVIFSTNAAESGITINILEHVIDAGRKYESVFKAEEGLYELGSRFISRSESDQRRGRVGRVAPGTSYRLFSEEDFMTKFLEYKEPEILVEDITGTTLTILGAPFSGGELKMVDKIYDNMPNPPTEIQRNFANKTLRDLGLMVGERLSKLGQHIAAIGQNIDVSIILIRAVCNKIMHPMCKIMALFTLEPDVEKWFKPPRENGPQWPEYQRTVGKWADSRGEIFVLKKIYEGFIEKTGNARQQWCEKNFLNFGKLMNAERQFWKMRNLEKKIVPIYEPEEGREDELIIKCFEHGFANNVAIREGMLYKIDRPVGFVKIEKPAFLKSLGKKIIFMKLAKINGKVAASGILNIS